MCFEILDHHLRGIKLYLQGCAASQWQRRKQNSEDQFQKIKKIYMVHDSIFNDI